MSRVLQVAAEETRQERVQQRNRHTPGRASTEQRGAAPPCCRHSQSYSRSPTKLDGGERAGGAVGVLQQLLHGDADGHHSDRVGVGLVKHSAQTLNGLGLC